MSQYDATRARGAYYNMGHGAPIWRTEGVSDTMQFALVNNFAARVVFWHDFYSVAGEAAATLLGLVFVAMSLRADPTGRQFEREQALWTLAAGVLAMFADVVLLALVVLIPDQTPLGVGLPALVLGALVLLIDLVVTRGVRRVTSFAKGVLATPLLGCLLQVLAGVGIIVGQAVGLVVLAVATGILLASALLASWLLLSGPALAILRRSAPPAHPPTS